MGSDQLEVGGPWCVEGMGGQEERKEWVSMFAEPSRHWPSWAYLPASRGQPLQSPQEAARMLEALQVLVIGGDLQGRERTVGWPIPDSSH